ncbi:hypothetical protein ACCS60_04890 [Rhizobium acaciae]|uniref:hypothetical protein n=1 Tax=Rhizobium acaciae TaxID=2989736 RepID=UPI000518FDA7
MLIDNGRTLMIQVAPRHEGCRDIASPQDERPADLQPEPGMAGPGKVSIIARQGNALPGKTLLACEFVQEF